MKWLVVVLCAFNLHGMELETGKSSLKKVHALAISGELLDNQEDRAKLKEFITESINDAKDEQNQLITRYRVKGAVMVLVMSGVAIYTTISSLTKAVNDSSGSDSDEPDYVNAGVSLVNSGFLFYYSGKEIWKIARNHNARRNHERALLLKYIYKDTIRKEMEPVPLQRSRRLSNVNDVSSDYSTKESGDE